MFIIATPVDFTGLLTESWNLESGKTAFRLNSRPAKGVALKVRVPRFLTPRRKYEVNESMLVVKNARSKLVPSLNMTRDALAPFRRGLVAFGRRAIATTNNQA